MRKRINLLLIIVMGILMTLTLVACNQNGGQYVGKTPVIVGDGDGQEDSSTVIGDGKASLKFSFAKLSSVFSTIDVADFSLSDIKYQVEYTVGASITLSEAQALTIDNIREEDRPLLSKPGHHNIRVSVGYKGKQVSGSFALHLRANGSVSSLVNVAFKLNGGKALFGTTQNGVASTKVEKGSVFTWNDFLYNFGIIKDNFAISRFTSGNVSFEAGTDKTITIVGDTEFNVEWTSNSINVHFDTNLPAGSTIQDGKQMGSIADQRVVRNTGKIIRPDRELINVLNGYYFAGWYTAKVDGDPWTFNAKVGSSDITLYAHWAHREYSLITYTMGGTFKKDVTNSLHKDGTPITLANAENLGYTIVNCDVRFDVETGNATRVEFSGLSYGVQYDKYVAEVTVSRAVDANTPAKKVVLKIGDVRANLDKGNGVYVSTGIYKEPTCVGDPVTAFNTVSSDIVGYVKWEVSEEFANDPDKMGEYYRNFLFKNGISIKADRSLKLEKISDYTVNTIKIPATIKMEDGKAHPVSEIGNKACLGTTALGTLDMSEASNLTNIGEQAFAYCPNLTEIIRPHETHIQAIGKEAFLNSPWERDYSEKNNNEQFIVFNRLLYKYVGANTVAELNTGNRIETIADSAFSDATALEKVTLGSSVKRINNYAFANLSKLSEIVVPNDSLLEYVGAEAFNGSDMFISGVNETGAPLPNNKDGAIMLGSIFYRYTDKTSTSYMIPDNVRIIADFAFKGCDSLADIDFGDSSKITYVGANAFAETAWIRKTSASYAANTFIRDGFVVINGILAEYYSVSQSNVNIIIPDEVREISSYAFNSYARFIETVQIKASVRKIAEKAFAGASSLVSLIFADVEVNENDHRLSNIPSISSSAFANANGESLPKLKLYFSQEVIDYFGTADAATQHPEWRNLYILNESDFGVETITGIWINPRVVSKMFIKTGTYENALYDTYPSGEIANGLVLMSSTGVVKYEKLSFKDNDVSISDTDGASGIVLFTYDGSTENCHINETFINAFKYNVVFAPKSAALRFDGQNSTIVVNATSNDDTSDFWISGFNGDITNEAIPVFFTSRVTLDSSAIRFNYRDIKNNPKSLEINDYRGFSPSHDRTGTVEFTVDFFGIGHYIVRMNYVGRDSQFAAIRQTTSVSVPLNGDALRYLNSTTVNLVGQDGIEDAVALNSSNFTVIKVDGVAGNRTNIKTDTIGFHTITVTYTRPDALNGYIEADIVYSVVLEAEEDLFTFMPNSASAATITGCLKRDVAELVLPNSWYDEETKKTYEVTAIKDGVFSNFTNLKTVYLPSTLETIKERAFVGCTSLQFVHTARGLDKVATSMTDANFRITGETVVNYGSVKVTGLSFGSISPPSLTVPRYITLRGRQNKTDQNSNYVSNYTTYATPELSDTLFDNYVGKILLYNSDANRKYAEKYLANKTVEFYDDENSAIVTSQNRFVFNDNDVVIDSTEITRSRRLENFDNLTYDDMLIVDYLYESESDNGKTKIKSYTDSVANTLTLNKAGVDVYLPDSVFNICSIRDSAGADVRVRAYQKSADKVYQAGAYLPRRLQYIGTRAFEGCSSIYSLDISLSANIEYIGAMAFARTSIDTLDLSNATKLEGIENEVFEECVHLKSVKLPSSVKYIGDAAFRGCSNLESITGYDQNTLEEVHANAFIRCDKLKEEDRPKPKN